MPDIRVTVPNKYNFLVPTSTDFPLAIGGLGELVQLVYKHLVTTPGRDVFSPQYGAGIAAILPSAANTKSEQSVKTDVSIAIMKTEEDIKFYQASGGDIISPDEALDSLRLEGLEFDPQQALWSLSLRITTQAGITAIVGIDLSTGSAIPG